jgi:hypothetical protein
MHTGTLCLEALVTRDTNKDIDSYAYLHVELFPQLSPQFTTAI